jgi:hypothetical protein
MPLRKSSAVLVPCSDHAARIEPRGDVAHQAIPITANMTRSAQRITPD